MPIPNLTIIGETINDSVPSTKKLFDAGDINGILEIARNQDEKGAAYIDVNVGPRLAEFMAEMVAKIQAVTARSPCRSTRPTRCWPRPACGRTIRRGPAAASRSSIRSSPLREGMFDLYKLRPFKPILLVSEAMVDGHSKPCRTAEETYRGGPTPGRNVPGPLWRRDQRRLHPRSGHRAVGQRLGGKHPPAGGGDGANPLRIRSSPAATPRWA